MAYILQCCNILATTQNTLAIVTCHCLSNNPKHLSYCYMPLLYFNMLYNNKNFLGMYRNLSEHLSNRMTTP